MDLYRSRVILWWKYGGTSNARKDTSKITKPDGSYIHSRTAEKRAGPNKAEKNRKKLAAKKSKELSKNDTIENLPPSIKKSVLAAKKSKTETLNKKKPFNKNFLRDWKKIYIYKNKTKLLYHYKNIYLHYTCYLLYIIQHYLLYIQGVPK